MTLPAEHKRPLDSVLGRSVQNENGAGDLPIPRDPGAVRDGGVCALGGLFGRVVVVVVRGERGLGAEETGCEEEKEHLHVLLVIAINLFLYSLIGFESEFAPLVGTLSFQHTPQRTTSKHAPEPPVCSDPSI